MFSQESQWSHLFCASEYTSVHTWSVQSNTWRDSNPTARQQSVKQLAHSPHLPLRVSAEKSDQNQFSPTYILTSSKEKVMRIDIMNMKGERLWSLVIYLNLFLRKCMENSLENLYVDIDPGLSKVASCRQKSLPTWLVSASYSAWHFFTDGVF